MNIKRSECEILVRKKIRQGKSQTDSISEVETEKQIIKELEKEKRQKEKKKKKIKLKRKENKKKFDREFEKMIKEQEKQKINKLSEKEKQVLRKLVRYTCEMCHRKEEEVGILRIHRIIRGNSGGEYTLRNIRILCLECHHKVHSGEFK
jgi:predicted nuclease with TOPRIM domain